MATQTVDCLEAIAHLPAGGTLIVPDVSWDEYERLVAGLGDRPGVRVTYDQGRLEIMSPSFEHDSITLLISLLVFVLADAKEIVLEGAGSTTYKQEWLKRGVEPDACFYVQNAARIIGVRRINLKTDPPPDIVVEVDVTHDSNTKMKIYAGMSVPELWHHDGRRVQFYQLVENEYVAIAASPTFPILTGAVLTRFTEQGLAEGQTAALRSFREWLRAQV